MPGVLGERAWIALLRKLIGGPTHSGPKGRQGLRGRHGLTLGLGDDCAILQPQCGQQVLVTTDFSLETVHFRRDWHTPESVGHRCLARGLSDLASMGARPMAAFLSLALPDELLQGQRGRPSWRDRFYAGFLALAEKYGVPLAGGDTARSPRIMLPGGATGLALADIVLIGTTPRNRALLRSAAKAGDRIYVTGHLGGSAAELAQLSARPHRFRDFKVSATASPNLHPHLFPQPRLAVGAWLLKNSRATAAIDISDGLSTDLDHICEESSLAAVIDAGKLPLHPLAQSATKTIAHKSLDLALHGGEDYELLFTASQGTKIPRSIAGVPVTCIGEMRRQASKRPRVAMIGISRDKSEHPLLPKGWEH